MVSALKDVYKRQPPDVIRFALLLVTLVSTPFVAAVPNAPLLQYFKFEPPWSCLLYTSLAVVIFIVIATTAAFIVRYSINKKAVDVKDIVRIEIDESGGSSGYTALRQHHEIDFESNTAATHIENPNADPKQSDSKTTFTEKDKEYFIKYANYYGFFNWKESYTCDYYDTVSYTHLDVYKRQG